MSGRPQLFRGELLALPDHIDAAMQHIGCVLQQFPLPLPTDQPALASAKIFLRKSDQRSDQFWDAVAPARRDFEIGAIGPVAQDGARAIALDLLTHRPLPRNPLLQNFLVL